MQSKGRTATLWLVALAAFCAPICAPAPATAFTLFGMEFFENEEPEEAVVIENAQTYRLDLIVSGDDKDVEKAVRGASALVAKADQPPVGTPGLLARIRGDMRAILAALYRQGRYGGTIKVSVGGRPLAAVQVSDPLPPDVPVGVVVDPGPAFTFGSITIQGAPDFANPKNRRLATPEDQGLVSGAPAKSGIILLAESSLVEGWRNIGHPKAAIGRRDVVADHRELTLDITLAVVPGPMARFGSVSVSGTDRMDPEFVARQTNIKAGAEFDPEDLEDARERLRRLEVFRSVTIAEAEAVGSDGFLPIAVSVQERKRRVFGGGILYSSIDGVDVETYWAHRNLFGRAEQLRLEASVGGYLGQSSSDPDYRLAAIYKKPGLFTPSTDLTLLLAGARESTDTFKQDTFTASGVLGHQFSRNLRGSAGLLFEQGVSRDAFGDLHFTILAVPASLEFDNRDSTAEPTEGFRAMVFAEPFTNFQANSSALYTRGTFSTYFSPGKANRFILAGRLTAGTVQGSPLPVIPAGRRFLAGGGGSVRGYGYKTIGIVGPGGETTGGRSLLGGSAELRVRVGDKFGLVPFVDAAQVFAGDPAYADSGVKVGVGAGFRYYTPLGPFRVDVATPLDPGPDDPDWALYVGLGQAF